MAVSSTTFEERLARINSGTTVDKSSLVGRKLKRQSFRARCLTFPFMTGVGILTAGTALALTSTPVELGWVVALAG
ncbi:hypothetical protein HKX54_02730 [Sulfitobacter sp. M57]|uniref:hypothetical protein n=1 Tax=unclassified Sulfitobacter TaxID=196795 RepID=UPI0023E19798|nr:MULTISPECIES: hypothetical protein [unclassified Sulfitobacter]MDF3413360.1 hypothetical protein [Sulfitobacter sp. KE5]MDF3421360.1 hypothetical protein [Sulfitobacter sp. KE43]MDF3431907.1 hypothetical protein [Sulfitobacter sp. KE42]MDF3457547.1 hypothetical protein [Sulfitobacter sp. S74]MDF3461449.1 hypothetical protein [Sulfitobacter sp. Ks18]